jgi:hypothetical protein
MRKIVNVPVCSILLFLVFLTIPAGFASAIDILWTNGGGNGLWTTATNWLPANVPSIVDNIKINSLPGPLINAVTYAEAQWLVISDGAPAALNMTGGTFYIFDLWETNDSWFIIANNSSGAGTFTLDEGSIVTGNNTIVGYKGQGTLIMNGGTIDILGLFGIGYNDVGAATGEGYVYLNGGTITAADFQMASPTGCTGLLDITGGTLIIDGDKTSLVNSHIAGGRIVAYGGSGIVEVDYNTINPGKTTVRWFSNPQQAANPEPGYNEVNVPPDANLSWTAGVGATSHNIYFGTTSPPTFIGNQPGTTFDPGTLDFNTIYYWHIDEIIGANTITGLVWTFTTTDGLAEDPDPTDGATGVAVDKVLNWTAGAGATSHDVFFGTNADAVGAAEHIAGDLDGDGQVNYKDLLILTNYWLTNPAGSVPFAGTNNDNIVDFRDYALLAQNWRGISSPQLKGNFTVTSYDPDLVRDANYYWRVDEVNGANRCKGNVWSFNTHYSLIGKIMCGYQGWFNCPSDGTTRNWIHWSKKNSSFTPSNPHIDLWPDMSEYDADEKFLTGFDEGSTHFYVFSSHNLKTVRRHFQWMQQYGIDGIYLQRFATEIKNRTDKPFLHRNDVLDYCKDGANLYGRKYAVMYDLTGLGAGETSYVREDWKYLLDTKQVTRDPADYAYMRHRGKPVVAIWGIGFGRAYEGEEVYNLVNFLQNDPVYGGNIVMIGVNDTWRSSTDPWVQATYLLADIISPWSVGRYKYPIEITYFTNNVWIPDILWCQTNSTPGHLIEYLPVIWPGYSFHNADPDKPFNEMPRNGGHFFWSQVYATVAAANANMLYIAMFDEVDEGTAIFKVTNNPPRPGGVDMFITYDIDGYPLPSDEYLWLTGQAGKGLRSEIPVTSARPVR